MHITHSQSVLSKFLFNDTNSAWFWLILRVYLGYEWLYAGYEKVINPAGAWIGANAGTAITGFLNGSLQKVGGAHPDVSGWYAYLIQHVALPNATLFSYMVTYGEVAIGLALIFGLFTGLAAFFATFMNFNFMLAGTVSVNPEWALMGIFLFMARKVAGYYGLDRYASPVCQKFFKRK